MMKKKQKVDFFPLLLISPTIIVLGMFSLYPTIRTFTYSLLNYQRNKPKQYGFIGFENLIGVLHDTNFYSSLVNSVKWVGWEVILQLVIGMLFALVLNTKFRGRGIARTICFAPWAISGVLTTMLWILIYNENIGLLNNVFAQIGLKEFRNAWISNSSTVFPAVVIAELWRGIPFFAINILAALQGISSELYESAKVDGANAWQTYWRITLPFLKENIIFATLMRCIWEFQSVDMILTMTNGGPNKKTTTLPIYMYQKAVVEGNYGYGAALAVFTFLLLSIFAVVYLKMNDFGKGINE